MKHRLYAIGFDYNGAYMAKVGISIEPRKRIQGIQTGNPFVLDVLLSLPLIRGITKRLERRVHILLEHKGFHVRGEWFGFSSRDAAAAAITKAHGRATRDTVMTQAEYDYIQAWEKRVLGRILSYKIRGRDGTNGKGGKYRAVVPAA